MCLLGYYEGRLEWSLKTSFDALSDDKMSHRTIDSYFFDVSMLKIKLSSFSSTDSMPCQETGRVTISCIILFSL